MANRLCSRCKNIKNVREFDKDKQKKDGVYSSCKSCKSDYSRGYNADRVSLRREHNLRKQYGMTQADYEDMLKTQGGGCAICGSARVRRGDSHLVVDHDHTTNSVRGILCLTCNLGLGRFKDNPVTLRMAADYLEISR